MSAASTHNLRSLRRLSAAPALTLLALLIFSAAPAGADWLVMSDGARIETDGPWTERGRLVVFTDPGGTLMSVRLAEVDMDASYRVTAEMKEAALRPPPLPPPPAPSIFSLTDDDVGHVDDDEYSQSSQADDEVDADSGFGSDADADADFDAGSESATTPLIGVVAWERDDNPAGDGLEVRATLENQGTDVAINIEVTVTLLDEDDSVLATAPGRIGTNGLMPGQTTEMIVDFPGIFDFAAVDFDIEQRALATRPMDDAPSLGEDFGSEGFPVEG